MISLVNEVLCVCLLAVSNTVGAFQPLNINNGASLWTSKQRALSSSFSLSSSVLSESSPSSPSVVDIRSETKSPVTVVTANAASTATAAALINGPAHAASLQNNGRPNDDSKEAQAQVQTRVEVQETSPPAPTPQKPITRKAKKSAITIAASTEELLGVMNGNYDTSDNVYADDAMTLILFHATYCKICQRAAMQLNKAAKEYPSVRFAKVEAQVFPEPASDHLRTLGVSKFPFVQIYRKGKCVASFSTGPTHMFMRKIRETLDLCSERDDACWESFETDFAGEIESNRLARKNLGPLP